MTNYQKHITTFITSHYCFFCEESRSQTERDRFRKRGAYTCTLSVAKNDTGYELGATKELRGYEIRSIPARIRNLLQNTFYEVCFMRISLFFYSKQRRVHRFKYFDTSINSIEDPLHGVIALFWYVPSFVLKVKFTLNHFSQYGQKQYIDLDLFFSFGQGF